MRVLSLVGENHRTTIEPLTKTIAGVMENHDQIRKNRQLESITNQINLRVLSYTLLRIWYIHHLYKGLHCLTSSLNFVVQASFIAIYSVAGDTSNDTRNHLPF